MLPFIIDWMSTSWTSTTLTPPPPPRVLCPYRCDHGLREPQLVRPQQDHLRRGAPAGVPAGHDPLPLHLPSSQHMEIMPPCSFTDIITITPPPLISITAILMITLILSMDFWLKIVLGKICVVSFLFPFFQLFLRSSCSHHSYPSPSSGVVLLRPLGRSRTRNMIFGVPFFCVVAALSRVGGVHGLVQLYKLLRRCGLSSLLSRTSVQRPRCPETHHPQVPLPLD